MFKIGPDCFTTAEDFDDPLKTLWTEDPSELYRLLEGMSSRLKQHAPKLSYRNRQSILRTIFNLSQYLVLEPVKNLSNVLSALLTNVKPENLRKRGRTLFIRKRPKKKS